MKENKIACVYHSSDLDGWCSSAIVRYHFGKDDVDCFGYNHDEPVPDLSQYEKVIVCDIAFSSKIMAELYLKLKENFIWIDHHISAINEIPEIINGSRNTKFAACELTWKYFFSLKKVPEFVRLIGMFDIFSHKGTSEEKKVEYFQYGARSIIFDIDKTYSELVDNIYCDDTIPMFTNIGKHVYEYLKNDMERSYKNGFPIKLASYNFICVNKPGFHPKAFNIDFHKDGYDGAAGYYFDGSKYDFVIYSDTIDCSVIAKSFGGGGHIRASGFRLNHLEFVKLVSNI